MLKSSAICQNKTEHNKWVAIRSPNPLLFSFFLLIFHVFTAFSYSTVKFLPGFHGPLPFHLETGYVGVGDSEQVQLFYYFIKSEGNPQKDPLIFWFTGGPGCSALSPLAAENGPINFKIDPFYDGISLPQLILNPHSWTKKSSIIFLDLPVGTGFSYATIPQAFKIGDFSQIHHSLQFIRKWFIDHPEFISNPFYVGGDSYSGIIVPVVTHEILEGNKRASPLINLQGYILGNPITIHNSYDEFKVPFAHRMTLISDELFESLTTSCKGQYVNIDPSNVECLRHFDTYRKCTMNIEEAHILLPKCAEMSPRPQNISSRRFLYNTSKVFLHPPKPLPTFGCADYKFLFAYNWANDNQVRKALHIHKGSIGEWIRCNRELDYQYEIDNVVPYHIKLSAKGYRSLVYSGDHDLLVPHLDTQAWIKSLNYSIIDDWRPWFIVDQVAGYTRTYANNMTFATIKGGGHTVEYTQKEGGILFSRWISGESL